MRLCTGFWLKTIPLGWIIHRFDTCRKRSCQTNSILYQNTLSVVFEMKIKSIFEEHCDIKSDICHRFIISSTHHLYSFNHHSFLHLFLPFTHPFINASISPSTHFFNSPSIYPPLYPPLYCSWPSFSIHHSHQSFLSHSCQPKPAPSSAPTPPNQSLFPSPSQQWE